MVDAPYQPPIAPSGQDGDSGRFDFIMNAGQPSGPSNLGLNANGTPNKMFFGIIAAVAVVILIVIVAVANSGGGADSGLVKIAQEQTELARVASLNIGDGELSYEDLNSEGVKAFALNTELSMDSAKADFLSFLGAHGVSMSAEQIALGQNPATDTQLTNANSNGNLDDTTQQVLISELRQYQATLQTVNQSANSQALRQETVKLFNDANLLIQQANQQ